MAPAPTAASITAPASSSLRTTALTVFEAVYPRIESPLSFVRGESETSAVCTSALSTPAFWRAAMMRVTASELAASAAAAVFD